MYWPIVGMIGSIPLLMLAAAFSSYVQIMATLFAGIALLLFMLCVARMFGDLIAREFTTYTLTDTHVIKEFGVITHRKANLVTDRCATTVTTPLIGKLFNYANMTIISTGLNSIRLWALPNAEMWQEEISKRNRFKVEATVARES